MAVKSEAEFIALIGGPYNQLPVTEVTGGRLKRDIDKYPNGLTNDMGAITGITQYETLTLKVPYDPVVHDTVMDYWSKWCGEAIDITITPIKVCPEQAQDGKPRTYLRCIPSELAPPEMKRGGNTTAYLELKFEPNGMKMS